MFLLPRLLMLLAIVPVIGFIALGQSTDNPPAPTQGEDVLRINTELVQTDVMVFDKHGRFVDNLRPQDFELRIDGQPRQINFFDRVTAGSRTEESQLAAARGEKRANTTSSPEPLDRGRIVFFFVDDLHLQPNNLNAARNVISHYLDREMGQNDQAAITSASGQIGFLQQVTDNQDVLHAAIARLKPRPPLVRDVERPPMSEYQALAIERNNHDVISYFVDELMKDLGVPQAASARVGPLPQTRAEQQVRDRAHLILQQAAAVSTSMLSSLESLVRSAGKLPGRKIVFFLSDGFFLDLRNSDSLERLRHITSAAARSGVVIYSVDARGLVTGVTDASSEAGVDPGGRLQRIAAGELVESQDGMNALAADTGGRTIFNTNSLDAGVTKALDETSTYYLLAWRPDNAEQRSEKFRTLAVSIVGHPDLIVRTRQGFFDIEKPSSRSGKVADAPAANAERTGDSQLYSAITAAIPAGRLPVSLTLAYVNNPNKGLVLTAALQVTSSELTFAPFGNKQRASVEIAGLVLNDQGKVGARFSDHLNVDRPAATTVTGTRDVVYSYPVTILPGLYQVRVGLRDQSSGAIGTSQDWIEIPDLSKTPLALSSLIISERLPDAEAADLITLEQAGFSVDHRFQRNSFLRLLTFIYSAQQPQATPDIVVQLQIFRDDQPVLTTSFRKLNTEGIPDLSRLPYAAEISLEHLAPGRYVLQVTANDRAAKRTAAQRARFEIE